MIDFILKIYGGVWKLALPLLKGKERLADGWSQRIGEDLPEGNYGLWIQSASGGESLLTSMVLKELQAVIPTGKKMRVIASSMTRQGVDTLEKAVADIDSENMEIDVVFFPVDAPFIMRTVYKKFSPRLIVVMETELWPSFLVEAKKREIPLLLVNGRMSEKSYGSYKYLKGFLKKYGPEHIWAISEDDCRRFRDICGDDCVSVMSNIKYDRIAAPVVNNTETLRALFHQGRKVVLFGSIRKEEEALVLQVIQGLKKDDPQVQIALFPKHVERADNWLSLLKNEHLQGVKRSVWKTETEIVVWDTFGELACAYGMADAVFVGGSLVDLGGQNFLEPLAYGIRPIIGPYWSDFFWVGRDIIEQKLVIEVADAKMLLATLKKELQKSQDRETVKKEVEEFLILRQGGTRLVCQEIVERLTESPC